jgi:diguanylate cyclase
MLRALHTGEMQLYYQPKLDVRSNRITSVEALVRWFHRDRGFIRPDLFIGMAEETGHIRQLTDWVLGRAVADQGVASALGHDLTFSINVSGRSIDDEDFAAKTKDFLAANPARICFEVTETGIIENPANALRIMEEFRSLGVQFSIDDYGTGLSSLSYLKRIPAKELKIDKSFVDSLGESRQDVLLIRSTIELAHNLGMTVVAEGIEDQETLATLGLMGCDVIQGYFISKPIPLSDLIEFLNQWNGAPALPSSSETDAAQDVPTVSAGQTA